MTITLPRASKPLTFAPKSGLVQRLLSYFEQLSETSPHFLSKSMGEFESGGCTYSLPRYIYLGPKGGGDTIRIGIFAGIHGDEPEGTFALISFLEWLETNRPAAKDYALFIYPICNPTGFEDGTRASRSGKDLDREFWTNSREPEVRYLESEIWTHAFDGIINLHTDDLSYGVYGFVNGSVLSENLLQPALRTAERFLPRNRGGQIDGFEARNGIIYQSYAGVLRSVPGLEPAPFELTFETPKDVPIHLQTAAINAALQSVLTEYRAVISVAQNI